jgi:hypothetical protein
MLRSNEAESWMDERKPPPLHVLPHHPLLRWGSGIWDLGDISIYRMFHRQSTSKSQRPHVTSLAPATLMWGALASKSSSTSSIHIVRCYRGNSPGPATRERSLNPNWVSGTYPKPAMRMILCKRYMRKLSRNDRRAITKNFIRLARYTYKKHASSSTVSVLTRCARFPIVLRGPITLRSPVALRGSEFIERIKQQLAP